LAGGQDEFIIAAASHCDKVVVIVTTPGAILMPWSADVASIFVNFMPGQEGANAAADVLFGTVNPSGKLPLTMPNVENEVGFTERQYPGLDDAAEAYYDERLLIGYRWYDAHGIEPRFPFGHGLSYAAFKYDNLTVSKDEVAFKLTNIAEDYGGEVVQLYLGFPSSAGEPPKQLKGFTKVFLHAFAEAEVKLPLRSRDRSVWDASTHSWSEVSGEFQVYVGSSSRDIRLTGSFTN